MAGVEGRCPTCNKQIKDLLAHLHSTHKQQKYTTAQLASVGLVACDCGWPCKNKSGVNMHVGQGKCPLQPAQRAASQPAAAADPMASQPSQAAASHPPASASSRSDSELESRFSALVQLPGVLRPLYGHVIPAFQEACDRLATLYLADPSSSTLFDILTFIKVGLRPAINQRTLPKIKRALQAYPNVPQPSPLLARERHPRSAADEAVAHLEHGRIRRAAQAVESLAPVAPINDATMAKLRSTLR